MASGSSRAPDGCNPIQISGDACGWCEIPSSPLYGSPGLFTMAEWPHMQHIISYARALQGPHGLFSNVHIFLSFLIRLLLPRTSFVRPLGPF